MLSTDKKGVVIKRRDNCGYLREIYKKLIDMIMERTLKWEMYDYLCEAVNTLVSGNVPLEKLIVTKSIKSSYKAKNLPHVCVANKMRERGLYVTSGTRIRYIFLKTDNAKDPQYLRAESPDYYLEHKDTLEIDYIYYLEKQLVNPINEVLEVKFKKAKIMTNLLKLLKKGDIKTADEYFKPKFEIND